MKQNVRKVKNRLFLLLTLLLFVPIGVLAQNITVKGTVVDSTGETIIGATVVEKGNTGNGVLLIWMVSSRYLSAKGRN